MDRRGEDKERGFDSAGWVKQYTHKPTHTNTVCVCVPLPDFVLVIVPRPTFCIVAQGQKLYEQANCYLPKLKQQYDKKENLQK